MNRAVSRFRQAYRTGLMSTVGDIIPPQPLSLQVVGSRGEINAIEGGAITSSNQKQVGRTRHYIGTQDVSELYIGYNGFFVDSATAGNGYTCAEVNASNDYIIRTSVVFNGIVKQVKFGGLNQGVVPSGSNLYLSDKLLPSDFGLTVFAKQTEYWIIHEREFAIGQKGMFHQTLANSPVIAGERFMVAPVTAPTQLNNAGELTTANGWVAQSHLWFPYCTIGIPVQPMMAVATFGASIENGVGDGQGDGLNGSGGYFRKSLGNVNGKKIARIHLAKSGETIKSWLANSAKRRHMLDYVNHVMSGHGGNDYTRFETLADTKTRWSAGWALMKAKGARVEHYALSPKSDSTDAYMSLVNQTPRLGYEVNGAWRDAGNAWCKAQVAIDPNLDGFVDLGNAQTPSSNRAIWRVDLGQPTIDGTHPSSVVATAMGFANVDHLEILRSVFEDGVPEPPEPGLRLSDNSSNLNLIGGGRLLLLKGN